MCFCKSCRSQIFPLQGTRPFSASVPYVTFCCMFVTVAPTAELLASALGLGMAQSDWPRVTGRRRFDRAGNLSLMSRHADLQCSVCLCPFVVQHPFGLSHPSVRIYLRSQSLSTAKLQNPLTAHREREIKCTACISGW